jgi:hypothetical protein
LLAFVTDQIALVALYDAWDSYSHELQRLSVNEIRSTIERIGMKVLFSPVAASSNSLEAEMNWETFLLRAGKRDPLAKHLAVDEYNRQQVERIEAERQRSIDTFLSGEQPHGVGAVAACHRPDHLPRQSSDAT